MLSCEVWETFENTYFEEHLQMTASEGVLKNFVIFIGWAASDKVFCEKDLLGGW